MQLFKHRILIVPGAYKLIFLNSFMDHDFPCSCLLLTIARGESQHSVRQKVSQT